MATTKDTTKIQIVGQVFPTPRGKWDANTEYKRLDFVLYNGNGYVALEGNSGKVPSLFESQWILVCERGEQGVEGQRGPAGAGLPVWCGTWNRTTVYTKNSVVEYDGSSYVCMLDDTSGISPVAGQTWTDDEGQSNPYWILACKGVAYKIQHNGEVVFYTGQDVTGVKTYTTNVYTRKTNQKSGIVSEIPLSTTLEDMSYQLDYVMGILKKYNLD